MGSLSREWLAAEIRDTGVVPSVIVAAAASGSPDLALGLSAPLAAQDAASAAASTQHAESASSVRRPSASVPFPLAATTAAVNRRWSTTMHVSSRSQGGDDVELGAAAESARSAAGETSRSGALTGRSEHAPAAEAAAAAAAGVRRPSVPGQGLAVLDAHRLLRTPVGMPLPYSPPSAASSTGGGGGGGFAGGRPALPDHDRGSRMSTDDSAAILEGSPTGLALGGGGGGGLSQQVHLPLSQQQQRGGAWNDGSESARSTPSPLHRAGSASFSARSAGGRLSAIPSPRPASRATNASAAAASAHPLLKISPRPPPSSWAAVPSVIPNRLRARVVRGRSMSDAGLHPSQAAAAAAAVVAAAAAIAGASSVPAERQRGYSGSSDVSSASGFKTRGSGLVSGGGAKPWHVGERANSIGGSSADELSDAARLASSFERLRRSGAASGSGGGYHRRLNAAATLAAAMSAGLSTRRSLDTPSTERGSISGASSALSFADPLRRVRRQSLDLSADAHTSMLLDRSAVGQGILKREIREYAVGAALASLSGAAPLQEPLRLKRAHLGVFGVAGSAPRYRHRSALSGAPVSAAAGATSSAPASALGSPPSSLELPMPDLAIDREQSSFPLSTTPGLASTPSSSSLRGIAGGATAGSSPHTPLLAVAAAAAASPSNATPPRPAPLTSPTRRRPGSGSSLAGGGASATAASALPAGGAATLVYSHRRAGPSPLRMSAASTPPPPGPARAPSTDGRSSTGPSDNETVSARGRGTASAAGGHGVDRRHSGRRATAEGGSVASGGSVGSASEAEAETGGSPRVRSTAAGASVPLPVSAPAPPLPLAAAPPLSPTLSPRAQQLHLARRVSGGHLTPQGFGHVVPSLATLSEVETDAETDDQAAQVQRRRPSLPAADARPPQRAATPPPTGTSYAATLPTPGSPRSPLLGGGTPKPELSAAVPPLSPGLHPYRLQHHQRRPSSSASLNAGVGDAGGLLPPPSPLGPAAAHLLPHPHRRRASEHALLASPPQSAGAPAFRSSSGPGVSPLVSSPPLRGLLVREHSSFGVMTSPSGSAAPDAGPAAAGAGASGDGVTGSEALQVSPSTASPLGSGGPPSSSPKRRDGPATAAAATAAAVPRSPLARLQHPPQQGQLPAASAGAVSPTGVVESPAPAPAAAATTEARLSAAGLLRILWDACLLADPPPPPSAAAASASPLPLLLDPRAALYCFTRTAAAAESSPSPRRPRAPLDSPPQAVLPLPQPTSGHAALPCTAAYRAGVPPQQLEALLGLLVQLLSGARSSAAAAAEGTGAAAAAGGADMAAVASEVIQALVAVVAAGAPS